MSTLGDFQRQISAIFASAKTQGLKTQDVIPAEIQGYFGNLKELQVAKGYIKESEEREAQLKEQNEQMDQEIKNLKQQIEDLPEDFKQLQIDLKQAHHRIEGYKDMMNSAEERAVRYQQRWQEAMRKVNTTDELEKKIKLLDQESTQQRAQIQRLVKENRLAAALFEKIREKDHEDLEAKDLEIQELRTDLEVLENESDQLEAANAKLVILIEDEHAKSAANMNRANARLHRAQRLHSATVSEIKPLRKFSESCWDSIAIYQRVFQDLLNLGSSMPKTMSLPGELRDNLNLAAMELELYKEVYGALQNEGVELDPGREELKGLATSAEEMYESLQSIRGDVERFLMTLTQRPQVWQMIRKKFGTLRRR